MKLAIFIDQVFWFDGAVYSTDEPYILFPASFSNSFDEVVFIGRLAPELGKGPYVLDHPAIKIQPLPYYSRVYNLWKAGPRLYAQIREIVRANALDWDVVLISGPNPIGQLIAQECIKLKRPLALLVRQNLVLQVRFANRGLRQVLGVVMAGWQEWQFRRLARGRTVFTVGQEMAKAYGKVTRHVHDHFACLVSQAQIATFAAMPPRSELGQLLCVGRLSSEKGHRYLFAALARLKARGIACSLDIVGSGREEAELRAEVATLGLDKDVVFHGDVPYGPELFALYQRATALVVPSLSEGFPQVINEALCIGIPTIASTVGGIPAFLIHNETAMLVPPADVPALAEAVEKILSRADLRERLRRNGQALMRNNSLEANRDRVMQVIRNEVLRGLQHTKLSALADYPGGTMPNQPTVAAVVPLYNEISHVGAVVDALLTQDYPALTEIWLVDGHSADGTFEELQRLQVRDPRLKVLSNPQRVQAAAFNLVCSYARTDIIIRLDAHARYAADVIRRSVVALLATGAGGVGSIQRPLPSVTLIGQSIVAAHKSKFGIGLPKHRQDSAGGWVDTVWNGCYWKHVIEKVGPLREDFARTEDNDFNARVRALGYGLYLSPDIEAYYYPRQTLTDLWHQYKANGTAVVRTLFQNRQAIRPYHLVPLMFVTSLVLLLLLGIAWTPALLAFGLVLVCYISALLFFSIAAYHDKPGRYVLWLPLAFAVLHFSYGLGSIQGLLSRGSSQAEEILPASVFQGNESARRKSL